MEWSMSSAESAARQPYLSSSVALDSKSLPIDRKMREKR